MPEPVDQSSARQRRANWVGLRTIRQRPKVVGTLPDGEPIYEARGVRLVLRGHTGHFNRLVPCERCGRDQAGSPILSATDLDAPLRPIICADCVRRAGVTSVWDPDAPRIPPRSSALAPPAPPAPAPPVEESEPPPAPEPETDRVDALENRLAEVAARVEELSASAASQRVALETRSQREEQTLTTLRTAVGQAIGEVRAELTSAVQANAARLDGLEAEVRDAPAQEQALASLRTAVGQAIEQLRTDLAATVQANAARLDGLEAQVGDGSAAGGPAAAAAVTEAIRENADRTEGIEARLRKELGGLARTVDAQRADIAALGTALAETRAQVAGIVDAQAALRQALDRLEGDVSAAREASPPAALPDAAVDAQLGELATHVSNLSARLDEALAAVDARDKLLRSLEGRVRGRDAERTRVATPIPAPQLDTGIDLLDGLERQLQGASTRLAAMSGKSTADGPQEGEAAANGDDRGPARHPG